MNRAFAGEPRLIPREVLFGNPEKTSPQISPDGKNISYLAPVNGVLNVWVRTIGAQDDRPVTHDTDRGVRIYFWAHDNRHILFLQDAGGNENWHLYGTDLKTGRTQDFTPFENVQARVVGLEKEFPDTILISMNKENKSYHDVYRLDLAAGRLELIAKNDGTIASWVPDVNLRVLGAVTSRADGGTDFLVRADERSAWKKLKGWSPEEGMSNGPMGFSRDGRSVYLRDASGSDTSRFIRMDLAGGSSRVIAGDPQYDLEGVMFNPDTREPEAAIFEKDRAEYVILDPAVAPDIEFLKKLEPGDFSVSSRDDADKTWLVGYVKDDASAVYYSYDRVSKKTVFLFKSRPALDAYTLAPMEPVQFVSRDGLTIHGYLTFPPGSARKNLPLVVNVHGGPWARDSWGYNPQAQWLANRGYICFAVNYRGSTGYGKKFVNAGDKQWGGTMQNDVTDAVRWAIQKGYADPARAAIYGGSYGGYAALAGAAFTPDLYRCAVDVVGPSNLLTFLRTIPPYWSVYKTEFYQRVGDPEKEEDFLKSRSPFFHADKIRIPVLVAQGANDPRVNQQESEQIVEALKKKNIDQEYLLFPDEGHGFAKPENRLKFYAACEKFLTRHLGGRSEA